MKLAPYPGSVMKPAKTIVVFVTMVVSMAGEAATPPSEIVRTFSDPKVQAFNHLVVEKHTGRVYIGAVNRLYQLSPDLDLVRTEETGPRMDSDDCSVIGCTTAKNKKLTDNVNKALVIDYTTTRLIACGSLSQGICTVRNLHNISDGTLEVREAVVANNATASTVAFIAPGPPNPPVSQVMYVGVTFTLGSPCRSEVPAVSSRSLDKERMFAIAQTGVTTGTRMFVNSLDRERYPITYVYGFASEGFSYFLTTQMKHTTSSQYISKLVRVCHDDENYYSYTEIPIDCISEAQGGRKYNLVQAAYVGKAGSDLASDLGITAQDDVLFAVFSESDPVVFNKLFDLSAMCVYPLKAIRRKFMQNIIHCFSGKGQRGLDFISPSHQCVPTKLRTIGDDFCGLDVNTPLGGEQPVSAAPVLLFNVRLTAVVATSTGDFTVVFIGTSTGHLKKVVIESSTAASEYGDLVVEEKSLVNPDLHFDSQLMHLYVMTERKVSKIKVQQCAVYRNCLECLGVKDPYCGWCSLENRCSLHSDCQDAPKDPWYWMSYKSGRCTTITSVIPNQLQRTTAHTLELVIDNMPTLQGHFLCAFSALDKTLITNATRKSSGVNCQTPRTDTLPSIPPGQNHFTAKLSVRMTSGPDFVATNFTFFDCNTYSSCTQCVSSSFPCDWCVDGHRCTHDTAENCRNDILVTGISRAGPSYRSGPAFCPTINPTVDDPAEIIVASGMKKMIKVKAHIIGQFIVQTRFVCQFNIEGRVTSVMAQLLGDTIYCDSMEFSYTSSAPNITATFAVIWGGSKPLDNPDNVHIVIYRCRDMADDCGLCLTLPEKYNCGWCHSSKSCEVNDQCETGSAVWLNRSHTCPNSKITSFSPELGPWEGGTNITIQGINLGKNFQDIYSGISIAGVSCRPYEHLYIKSKQIVCQVDGPGTKELREGPVTVKSKDYHVESENHYRFVNPIITGITPIHAPISGGTLLIITGQYMNAGSNIEAFLDDLPCRILWADQNEALCITSSSYSTSKKQLKMKFDKGERFLQNLMFEYVEDPVTESAESGVANQIKVPTITSVIPNQLQQTTEQTLELVIDNMPTLQGHFLCAFTALDKTLITGATRKSSGVNCPTPLTYTLPSIPPGQHHFTAKLSVRMTSGPDFVATNFTFFDCNTYSSCTQCVSSSFPCDWCVDGHRCTHDTAENCRNDILVTGISRAGTSYRSGPAFCPTINPTVDDPAEIIVASGMKKMIKVKAHIIGQFIVQTRFVCQFNIEGRVTSVMAQLLGDTIYCDSMEFSYTSSAPNITATFAVIWGGSKPLDNPDNVHIVIYRCRDMADDCGLCLTLPEKYNCGWCHSSERCEVKDQCEKGSAAWLNRNHTCPNPEITSFTPELGPWEGGTNITIQGINLGKNFQDIYSGISIAGISCWPYEHLYIKSKQIVCQVDGPGTKELREGPVTVKVEDYSGESKTHYRFVNPNITGITPIHGPRSGGTMLTITGQYMNAGSNIQAFLDDLPCRILSADQNEALCITSSSYSTSKKQLKMKFDKGERFLQNLMFEYVEDPVTESAESGVANQIKVPTIKSVIPNQLQQTTEQTLELVIDNMPTLQGHFLCAFTASDKTLITGATRKSSGVNCPTPLTYTLPSIPPGQHHFTAKLSVRMTSGPDFVATNFTFFDCNTYTSCTQCVSSSFPCDWCVDGHQCTHATAENCRNDILVTGISRAGTSYRSGPAFCPTINPTVDDPAEIIVASGMKKMIKVKAHIIGQFIVQTRFVCQFNIEGRVTSVMAQLLGDTIYCDSMEFSYTSSAPNITATFAVIWGGSKPLDNPDNVHIVIYRCRDMADDCGLCLTLPEKYNCGWCHSSKSCEVNDQCETGSAVWLNRSHTCPNSKITSFSPELGPWEGGTNITIQGINLGKNFQDIYSGISIAGVSCRPYEHLYIKSKQIVCQVDGPGTKELREGPVTVKSKDYHVESENHYRFVNPIITGITPIHAPISGGTLLIITGQYMNAGSNIEAFLDDLPCRILWADQNEALCITSSSYSTSKKQLKMKFDKGERFLQNLMFEYVEDPVTESAESGVANQIKVPTITSVIPNQLQQTTEQTLELVIDNMPTLQGHFLCAFTAFDKTLITGATRKSSGVNCPTPLTYTLPSIPPGQHHFTAKLSVRMTSGPDFVATNFTFFDCNTYSSCTQCVSSPFPCDWCVDGHRCTHDTAENCRNDILVTGISRAGTSYRSGPAFCPTINPTVDDPAEIIVASGMKKMIKVKAHIIGQFIVQTRFVCQFNIEGRVTSVMAQLLGDTIYCDSMEFSYTSSAPNITATFAVIWGGSKPLDNPDNVHIVIYRCRDMADDCGLCLTLPEKYNCGWCHSSKSCEVNDQCEKGSAVWLNRSHTCPNSKITSFSPELGPWEGGTNITIQGINLGKNFQDIYSGISIAGVSCRPYEHLYIKSKQIVCQVDGPGTKELREGPVTVKSKDYHVESENHYRFVNPIITGITPIHALISGGTLLIITGQYMNAGSNIEAFLDDLPCRILWADQNEALCITSSSYSTSKKQLKMKFDKGERFLQNLMFEYVEDPVTESAESGVANQIKVPTIKSVIPNQLQQTTEQTLELVIDNMPTLQGHFLCAFTAFDKTLITGATRKSSGVNCPTPLTYTLPSIPPGQHHFTAKLSVRMTSGPDFVATNFTFFDCNTYSSCTQCVSSPFPCDWCVDGHRCTHDTAENCRNDILVTGISRAGTSYRSGPAFCPTINPTVDDPAEIIVASGMKKMIKRAGTSYRSGPAFCPTINPTVDDPAEIIVASGMKKMIKVKAHIIGQFIVQTRFVCQFNIEGRVTSVMAQLLGDTIYCDSMEFSYTSSAPNITATFAVIWGGSKPLDNPDNVHIVIYRCRDMADDCGLCLTLPEKYNCGWCHSSERCEVKDQCEKGSAAWLNRNHTCPNPEITSFTPELGPWEGGTNITIQGINLGKNFQDIYSGISIAGISCWPYEHLYIKSKQIVCQVDGPGTKELREGPVTVKVEDYRGESKTHYRFVNPNITGITPIHGPRSGGTMLTITGQYMNAGSNIQAFLDDLPCRILSTDQNQVHCITSSSDSTSKKQLKMKFDKGERFLENMMFEYVEDPVIESAESGVASQIKVTEGIPADVI